MSRVLQQLRRIGSRVVLGLALAVGLVTVATPAFAAGDYGPDTCLEGWVWRGTVASDHVCVTGAVRSQAAYDNSQAAVRRSPTGGPYGPDTCLNGWVWRGATSTDHVCVTGATRTQTGNDNAQAAARRDSLNVWHGTYTIPPHCYPDGTCTTTSTDSIPRFRLAADHLNVGQVTVQLRLKTTGAVLRTWTVTAGPAFYTPGGRVTFDTGVFVCQKAVDSYFVVRDPSSTRWSAPHYVASRCAVL
jgi:hypothetical protein